MTGVEQPETEVRALLQRRVEACRIKDVDRLMALYAPGAVYFDVVPPLHHTGTEAVRANFLRWFEEYEGGIDLETHELELVVADELAVAHMLHRDRGSVDRAATTRADGERELWLRSTVCCRRFEQGWLLIHEHISLPVDLGTMRAQSVAPERPLPGAGGTADEGGGPWWSARS